MTEKKIAILTSARLSSQRLPLKMVKEFCGTTLFDIACEKLEKCDLSEHAFVSLYDDDLKQIAKRYNVKIYNRSYESAHSDGPIEVIWDWHKFLQELGYDYYIMINSCLPMLSLGTINKFIAEFQKSPNDGLFAVKSVRDYLWHQDGTLLYPPTSPPIMNTKVAPPYYQALHALYGGSLLDLKNGKQMGDFTKGSPELMAFDDKLEFLDIDDQADWTIAESVYNGR